MIGKPAVHIKRRTPSPYYYGMWPLMQDPTDGRTDMRDVSGKGNHLVLGSSAVYATVTGTPGFASIVGVAGVVTANPATDRSLATPGVVPCDLFLGQVLIRAFTVKAPAPGATAHLVNARGAANDVKGTSMLVDNLGRPAMFCRDTATTTGVPTASNVICDDTPHNIVEVYDGVNKKACGYIDNVAFSSTTEAGYALSIVGSTQNDEPTRFGAAGDFPTGQGTWVAGQTLRVRCAHILVIPFLPSNWRDIVAELSRNPRDCISDKMLPLAS